MKTLWVIVLMFCCSLLMAQQNDLDPVKRSQGDTAKTDKPVIAEAAEKKRVEFSGQFTSWQTTQLRAAVNWQLGGRFVPTMLGNFSTGQQSKIDFEVSAHLYGNLDYEGLNLSLASGNIAPYRVWLRYAASNWELRGGLQKINFGPAKMFRPLMWFDGMDVRDPLKLTNGVYGLLGRYFFKNNANIWFWSLIGNKKPKGWELLGSAARKPEIGGRIEMPGLGGEIGLSSHFRKAEVHHLFDSIPPNTLLNESRFGVDGRWDAGVGLWFESSVTRTQPNTYAVAVFQDLWNIGSDYTFTIGNGLGLTMECFRYHFSKDFLGKGKSINVAGAMFTYPVSILDNISAMVFYEAGQKLWFNYVNWTRTYDKWMFYAMAFWNPVLDLPFNNAFQGKNLFSGKGLQLMATYNF